MTTIVAMRNPGIMLADMRVSMENSPIAQMVKIKRVSIGLVGASGDCADACRLVDWAEQGLKNSLRPTFGCPKDDESEALLLILDYGGISVMNASDSRPERIEDDFFAIGSGAKIALGALHMGATPKQAMAAANRYDQYTGDTFTILKLGKRT